MTIQFGKKYLLKSNLLLLLILTSVLPAFSQFEAQMSQYMFNTSIYNPASIGESKLIRVGGLHRIQWVGMPGAPQTTYFSINTPLATGKTTHHGVGIKFLNDRIGAFSNQSAHIQYAIKRKIGNGKLSIGADIGFIGVGFILDSIRNANVNSEFHDFLGDTAIPTTDETGMSIDLSLGTFYSAPKYYLGISYVHLNAPTIKMNDERTKFSVPGVLYFTGGYDFQLQNPKLAIRTTALAKSDFITWQAELSARMEIDKRYWGGISYRYQDAVVFFGGLNIMNGLSLGYAYDLPTTKMLTVSSGSHEISLNYSFRLDLGKGNNVYKSIRFL